MGKEEIYRRLPSVDELLRANETQAALAKYPRSLVTAAARTVLDELRVAISQLDRDQLENREFSIDRIAPLVVKTAAAAGEPRLRAVINATGVVLHTNLGRAPLAEAAAQAVHDAAVNYTNLEFDLESGKRGHRVDHVGSLLNTLTGAEAAMVVNNNAAAVLLALKALAAGREVIISRGELIEIGGSFRIPEIMAESQAILREVGTTNKTHPRDYIQAVSDVTALILKVHTSNYRIIGFTEQVETAALAELARARNLPLVVDLGSGFFLKEDNLSLFNEPTVAETVADGADLVTFSGDKLLGGPQAGIIVGRRDLITAINRHPLARALRLDKLSLAALEATLRLTLDQEEISKIPAVAMLSVPPAELRKKAELLRDALAAKLPDNYRLKLIKAMSKVGGGALPATDLPTTCVAVTAAGVSAASLAAQLRGGRPPIISRVRDEQVLLDPRTIKTAEIPLLAEAAGRVLQNE